MCDWPDIFRNRKSVNGKLLEHPSTSTIEGDNEDVLVSIHNSRRMFHDEVANQMQIIHGSAY
jgi:hypothetical protein